MKKLSWLLIFLPAMLFAFTSCDDPDPVPPGPEPGEKLTIVLTLPSGSAESNEVSYKAEPSIKDADYVVMAYPAAMVERCETDADIVANIYAELGVGVDGADYSKVSEAVVRGDVEGTIDGLTAGTSYYLLAFGVDAANDYALTSDVAKVKFTTVAVVAPTCSFELKAEVYMNSAAIDVTPSDNTQLWHLVNVTLDAFNEHTADDAMSLDEFFANCLHSEIDELKQAGMSDEDIAVKLYHKGPKTLNVGNLEPNAKYVALAAAVSVEGDNVLVSESVDQLRYTAKEAAATDLSFDITVSNIEHYAADIRIVPSDLNAEYYYAILPYDGKSKDAKAIDLVTKYVNERIYYWGDDGNLAYNEGVKGVQDFTGENKYELSVAQMEYYILVFSYERNPNYGTLIDEENGVFDENPGRLTSAPALVTFRTPANGDPMTAEFTFTGEGAGPYGFILNVETNDPTVYYMPGVAPVGSFDAAALIANYSGFLKTQMELYQIAEPGISNHRALEEWGSTYFRNGNGRYNVKNLLPDTEYVGYVLVIDAAQGIFVRGVASEEAIATTTSVGSVNPEVELLGIYNGNDENGTIFGNAAATAGNPIVAVKHTNVDGASALYGAISEGDDIGENGKPVSDQYIIAQFYGYWMEVNLDVPYNFYVAKWDIDQMVVAYALDADGREGKVDRLFITDWTKTNDIAELKAYVDEVNAAIEKQPEATALSCSMVYSESSLEPTIECIWSEDVGAPAEAEVIYHAVEPIDFPCDMVVVSTICSVRL